MIVSVIVPIYNAEDELKKCIESIRMQTYTDLEIILVNDGSTDRSFQICKAQAEKDNRIVLINKENGGSTSARKAGLAVAKGEYISPIDADDWIEPEYIERMVTYTDDGAIDMVASGYVYENEEGEFPIQNGLSPKTYQGEHYKKLVYPCMMDFNIYGEENIRSGVITKLFKRTLLLKAQMNVSDSILYDDDVAVTYSALLYASSVAVIPDCLYHRVKHDNSLSTNGITIEKYARSINHAYAHLKMLFANSEEKESLLLQLEHYYSLRAVAGIKKYLGYSAGNYIFPYEKIKQGSTVVLYGAGSVGRSFYKQIARNGYCKIVGWVDKKYKDINLGYAYVSSPELLKELVCDYVIICILNYRIAKDILDTLKILGVAGVCVWSPRYEADIEIDISVNLDS